MIGRGTKFSTVRRRLAATLATATAVAISTAAFGVAPAAAEFGVTAFDGQVNADLAGTPFTQAGGHPFDAGTTIEFNTKENPGSLASPIPDGNFKDVEVSLPPGFVGNPTVAPLCSASELAGDGCAPENQVGVASIAAFGLPPTFAPVFSVVPPPGVPAAFGFNIQGFVTNLYARVRTGGDYGVTVDVKEINQGLPVAITSLSLWGVPAAEAHNDERCGSIQGTSETGRPLCIGEPGTFTGPNSVDLEPQALLRNPTSCTAPGVGLPTDMRTDSWQEPGNFKKARFVSHEPPGYPLPPEQWGAEVGPTGCDVVPFNPSVAALPTTNAADSPSGLSFDLSIPQKELKDPDAIAQADLKSARVILPAGMSVNPSAADGLGACSSTQVALHSPDPANCPDDSKIGTVSIETPLLGHPIEGSVYLAAQGDNPFNSLLALYIAVADPESGVVVKLPGHVVAGQGGQLETVFDDQPQLPFERLHLELFGGVRAPLRTPATCGTHTSQIILAPWSGGAAVSRSSSFEITAGPSGSACPNGTFDPKLSAGTASPLAGTFSPFVLRLKREDGTRELSGLTATLPRGLIGKLAGIPYCPDAALAGISPAEGAGAGQVALPSCPSASQVGTVTVGAGAGATPFYVNTGRAYLAGPYKGAPLSLAIVTPAIAGPFDLGNVVVRTALQINPETTQITAVSDPIPTILYGIPLDVRDLRVTMSRPDFTLNPTSCEAAAIDANVTGVGGASANVGDRFQVANCVNLAFAPKLDLSVKGGTRRGAYQKLRAVLQAKPGQANIGKVSVALPHSAFLAQEHIRTICTRVQFAADACPAGSIYGKARAITPLLDQPLEGPVYLRSSSHELPDLVAALHGQIDVDLVGRIDSVNGGIRNTFSVVPDAPVSKFVLEMKGGKKSLLVNSRDICKSTSRATVKMDGQNGKTHDFRPVLRNGCRSSHRKSKH